MTDSSQSQTQKVAENNQIQITSDRSGISAFDYTLENSKNLKELERLEELKDKISEKDPLKIFNQESEALKKLCEQENNMLNEINQKDKAFQLNDFIFEENSIKILSDVYGLKEYILYPHFDVGLSEKKRTNVTSIFYYKINFQIGEKKESDDSNKKKSSNKKKMETKNENDENKSISLYFLDDREAYVAKFREIQFIFQKEKDIFNKVRVLSKENDYISEFSFNRSGQEYEAFIPFFEIKEELIETQKKVIEANNLRDSTKDPQEKEKASEDAKKYSEELNSLKTEYSEKTIKKTLRDKKNELSQLEKDEKLDQKEKEKRKQKILNEIKVQEGLLKGIIIKIIRRSQEFDGFFFTTKEITLKNNIGGVLTIPAQKPIIVEAKNISNYKSLLDNIKYKRKLLEVLRLDESKFYYVGILRRIDDDKKQEAIQSIESSNKENTIIIYPDKWDFLGFPLYRTKKEIFEKDEAKNGGETSLQEEKIENKNSYNNQLMDMRSELENIIREIFQKEIEPLKQEVKGLKDGMDKLKGDVDELKDGMDKLKDDVGKIKKKINID